MPFSYLSVTTESNDGNTHNVRIYSDITGGKKARLFVGIKLTSFAEFLQDTTSGADIMWGIEDDGTNIILSERLVESMAFTEIDSRAADATEYYCYKRASFISSSIFVPLVSLALFRSKEPKLPGKFHRAMSLVQQLLT